MNKIEEKILNKLAKEMRYDDWKECEEKVRTLNNKYMGEAWIHQIKRAVSLAVAEVLTEVDKEVLEAEHVYAMDCYNKSKERKHFELLNAIRKRLRGLGKEAGK